MSDQIQVAGASLGRFDVFGGALALLAFVMAFYALFARERKTPYMINSLYSMSFFFLFVLSLSALGRIFASNELWARNLEIGSLITLLAGIVFTFIRIWSMHNRHMNFRDDNLFKNLSVVRGVKRKYRRVREKRRYEENPSDSGDWVHFIENGLFGSQDKINKAVERAKTISLRALSLSIGFRTHTISGGDEIILSLTKKFLQNKFFVQYATCTRHPLEFVLQLEKKWDGTVGFNNAIKHLVIVDAYTPHFAFTDGIHEEANKDINERNIKSIKSSPSFAGLHTATTKAFNYLKESDDKSVRRATLIIYDGLHALVDLESSEQYRIFIRHVIPSERQYGGMLTVFIEPSIEGPDLELLKAYVDLFQDRTSSADEDHSN